MLFTLSLATFLASLAAIIPGCTAIPAPANQYSCVISRIMLIYDPLQMLTNLVTGRADLRCTNHTERQRRRTMPRHRPDRLEEPRVQTMGKLLLQLLMGQTSIRKMVGLLLHQGLTMSRRSKLRNLDMA